MFTPSASSTPQPTGMSAVQGPTPASSIATCIAAFQAARPASTAAGATPHPASSHTSLSNPVGEGRGEVALPWQRLDAAWPVIANSPTGLDGDAQRLVRSLLTQAAGKRLQRRRSLEAAALWIWAPMPYLAEYVRQQRFYAPGLPRLHLLELYALLRKEASLELEVLATPPSVPGVEVWQELLELQCKRIGQVYAALHHWLPAFRAQEELQRILEGLL